MDDSIRYRLLNLLYRHPELIQRELARQMGISLGKLIFIVSLNYKPWTAASLRSSQ
ncbi:MAG: winged helix-turn-helix transcriptional regulator [Desulfopila sp.]